MNYEYYGSGPKTIVFLHGWGGGISSFKGVADVLQDRYKVLNLDFAGFGESQPPDRPYSVEDYAKDVLELLNNLHIQDYYVVAHSFGGRVAIKMCAMGACISKLVLVDSAGIKPRFSFVKWIKIRWYKLIKFLVKLRILSIKHLDKYGSMDYKKLNGVMRDTFVKVVSEDLSADAKKVKCETLLVWGEKDKDTPLYMAKKLNQCIKNSVIITINGVGHFSYLQKPRLFLNILTEVFKE